MRTLGFDTSNYTTSVAVFNGVSGENCSRLLDVRPGELGLRQSDALFAHVKRLPEMTDELFAALPKDTIRAVGASTRPRAVDGSYMPCFLAGSSQAQTLARILDVPFYAFSHQQGAYRGGAVVGGTDGADAYAASGVAPLRRHDGAAAVEPDGKNVRAEKRSAARAIFPPVS